MTTLDTSTGAALDALEFGRQAVQPALRAAVDTLPDDMRHIARYHFGWTDENGNAVPSGGGKALRPTLVLLSAHAVGTTGNTAVPAAVAIELVHNFSLLHDDVMDHDTTRRHRPTAWRVFGANAAILAGDALSTLASGVLAESGHSRALPAVRRLNTAVQELIRGQIMDLAFERRGDVDVPECRRMALAKTGALLGCACELGALLGDGTERQIDHLRGFGRGLGLAFQHTDDFLGIWGDPEVTGKSTYSDLRGRKKTLPVVAALHSGTTAGRTLSQHYQRNTPLRTTELSRIAELIDRAGGRAWNDQQAERVRDSALEHLHQAAPSERTTALVALAQLATQRDR